MIEGGVPFEVLGIFGLASHRAPYQVEFGDGRRSGRFPPSICITLRQ